jgi:hypothetical protein
MTIQEVFSLLLIFIAAFELIIIVALVLKGLSKDLNNIKKNDFEKEIEIIRNNISKIEARLDVHQHTNRQMISKILKTINKEEV